MAPTSMHLGPGLGYYVPMGGGGGGSSYFDTMSAVTGVVDFWDITDLGSVWTTSARATNVATDSDPVGYVDGQLGVIDLQQATSSRRPLWKNGGGQTYLLNDGVDDQGLSFVGGTRSVSTVVGCFQYQTGLVSTFSNYHTFWVSDGALSNPGGNAAHGNQAGDNMYSGLGRMDRASINGAPFANAGVVPLPYSTVANYVSSLLPRDIGAVAAHNSATQSRAWTWIFNPVCVSTSILTAEEVATIAAACAAQFGSAS